MARVMAAVTVVLLLVSVLVQEGHAFAPQNVRHTRCYSPAQKTEAASSLAMIDTSQMMAVAQTSIPSSISTIVTAAELSGAPAVLMLLFTILGLRVKTSPVLVGALQHFAAGILLSTIAIELLPEMMNATGFQENLASGVGFFLGVAVLIALGILLPEDDDRDEATVDDSSTSQPLPMFCQSLRNRQQSYKAEAFCKICDRTTEISTTGGVGSVNEETTKSVSEEEEVLLVSSETDTSGAVALQPKELSRDTSSLSKTSSSFPTALLTAIAIDSALDGLLIGIAIAAGPSTGPMLAASLSVEMSFLGLTLATALYGLPFSESLPASVLGPAAIVLGAVSGGALASRLADSPVLLAGLMGFGTSALLFMVAEELLLEAHEEGEHVWWSDLQLYVGFFASVMVDKFVLVA